MRACGWTSVSPPMLTSPVTMQYGPIVAVGSISAAPSTMAVGWMLNAPPVRGWSAGRGHVRRAARAERADERLHGLEAVLREVRRNAGVDLLRLERIVEERRAEPDRGRAREQKLERVVGRLDAALADDRNAVRPADLRNLIDLEQRERPDRGTGQPALHVADDRAALGRVDRHAHDRVDRG